MFWGLLGGSEFHFLAIARFRELLQIILKKCISTTNHICLELDPYFLLDYMNIISQSITLFFTTLESHSTLLTRSALLVIFELNSMAWIICRIYVMATTKLYLCFSHWQNSYTWSHKSTRVLVVIWDVIHVIIWHTSLISWPNHWLYSVVFVPLITDWWETH